MYAFWTLLFWIVIFEKKPALPSADPSEITTAELLFTPLITMQFLRTSLVTGVVPTEPTQITLGVVTLVLVMVRLRSVPPLLDPSMVMKLAPLNLIRAPPETLPLRDVTTPVAGLMVTVFAALDPG